MALLCPENAVSLNVLNIKFHIIKPTDGETPPLQFIAKWQLCKTLGAANGRQCRQLRERPLSQSEIDSSPKGRADRLKLCLALRERWHRSAGEGVFTLKLTALHWLLLQIMLLSLHCPKHFNFFCPACIVVRRFKYKRQIFQCAVVYCVFKHS